LAKVDLDREGLNEPLSDLKEKESKDGLVLLEEKIKEKLEADEEVEIRFR